MKPAVIYLLTSLNTTGGTVSKIKSTLRYTRYRVYVAAYCSTEDEKHINNWDCEKNADIIRTHQRNKIFKNVLLLNKVIRKKRINMIHTFFPNEMLVAFFLKLLNPNLKIIRSFEGNVKRRWPIRTFSRIILPYFNKIIFISNYVKDFYTDITRRCKDKEIVDNAGYHICEYKYRERSDVCKIVSVAGLNKMKNVFMYAEIGKVLKSRGLNFVIKVAGDGPLKNELNELIIKYGLQEQVVLLGSQVDPKPYYNEAFIYIHPADKEGFGITVAEAMSSGLPVIVSDRGGVPELVNNMEDGIIVDAYNPEEWADAIIKLYNDRELYEKLSKNGYETYKARFTPEIYAGNLDKIYDTLLSLK